MDSISYKKGYKYQLKKNYSITIPINPKTDIKTAYIDLTIDGNLTIKEGYAWDGPSGPTLDTRTFMRGSLVHDALYQLIREEHLDRDEFRSRADRLLRRMCKEDRMNSFRAWWIYQGVRFGAGYAANPANKKPLIFSPKPRT